MFNDPGHLEKEGALSLTSESMFQSESVFLANPGYRKRLARKPRQKHIMWRNTGFMNLCDITCHEVFRVVPKVRLVSSLGVDVPLAGKNALATNRIESCPDPTDSCKKVYKPEGGVFRLYPILRGAIICRRIFHSVTTRHRSQNDLLLGVVKILRAERKACQAGIRHYVGAG